MHMASLFLSQFPFPKISFSCLVYSGLVFFDDRTDFTLRGKVIITAIPAFIYIYGTAIVVVKMANSILYQSLFGKCF